MKWMLFVLVFGSHPVETNLLFDSLDACLKAEETMRTEYARAYSQGTWGTSVGESNDPSGSAGWGSEPRQPVFRMLRRFARPIIQNYLRQSVWANERGAPPPEQPPFSPKTGSETSSAE